MLKSKKILLTAVALFLVLLGLALVVPLFVNLDRFRPQVVARLQEQTGKLVRIRRLSLTIIPRLAIRVDDFSLGNPAGFPPGDFVSAERIYAIVDTFALLHHRVEITSLELRNPTVNMLEDTHGRWNFENPAAPTAASPPSAKNDGASFTLGEISRLRVKHGEFSAANLLASGTPGPALMRIHNASLDLRQVDLNAFTTAVLRRPATAPAKLPSRSDWLTTLYAADATGPAVAEGAIKAEAMEFAPLIVTNFKSKFRLFPKQADFDDLNLQCYSGSATGNLSVSFGGANLAYSVDAAVTGVNVAEFLAAFPRAAGLMTGTLDAKAHVRGMVANSPDPLAEVSGDGEARIRNGQMPSLQLGENLRTLVKVASIGPANGDPSSFSLLSADFHVADGRLSSQKISLVANGMDVDGAGSLTMAGEGSLDYTGNARLAASGTNPLASVLGGLAGAKFANGKMTFPFTVGGTLAKPRFALQGGATQQGGASPGNVQKDMDIVRGLSELLKKKKQP